MWAKEQAYSVWAYLCRSPPARSNAAAAVAAAVAVRPRADPPASRVARYSRGPVLAQGPETYCSPRHATHFETSFLESLESNGILRRIK